MKTKVLIVGGTFEELGGKPSGYITKLFGEETGLLINGGNVEQLQNKSMIYAIEQAKIIYWFPNVQSVRDEWIKAKYKFVRDIKKINQKCILVTSKRNDDGAYNTLELMAHALGNKSNLLVEFKIKAGRIESRVLDPLANCWLDWTEDIDRLRKVLYDRVQKLLSFTRVRSVQVEEFLNTFTYDIVIPNKESFFKIVRRYGEIFHELINPVNTTRFLGNSSFRCEDGFPSFKAEGWVFVSRRNIDKRAIGVEGYVPVELNPDGDVNYWGKHKPSVDTPIQLRLYQQYPKIKSMIHSHTYIKNAPITKKAIPCGAIEEFDEVVKVFNTEGQMGPTINLLGHGSITFFQDDLDGLSSQLYALKLLKGHYPRKVPEVQKWK